MSRKMRAGRYDASLQTKDTGGGSTKFALNFKTGGYEKVDMYQPEQGINKIIIIPFVIRSEKHPAVFKNEASIDELEYALDYWVHFGIGSQKATIFCPQKNYGKPCPICSKIKALSENYDENEQEIKAIKAKRRCAYNVMPVLHDEPTNDIQVFDVSHFLFEKKLISAASDINDGKSIVPFADLEKGYVIRFRAEKVTRGNISFNELDGFYFDKLYEGDIDVDSTIERAISFDRCIEELTPDEIMSYMDGGTHSGGGIGGAGGSGSSGSSDSEDREEKDEEGTPSLFKKNKKNTPPVDTKSNNEDSKDVGNKDTKYFEDDIAFDAPQASPTPIPAKGGSADRCPHSHIFGEDNGNYAECTDCSIYEECLTQRYS